MNSDEQLIIKPIGFIETPFDEKFAIPRQSTLIHNGRFVIHFYPPYNVFEAFDGISEFSHLWVTFFFHQVPENKKFSTKVRPPRLGGNITKGIFATRSPFRPNRLGLSVVRLLKVDYDSQKGISLIIEGADVVNGTPIIDVKPYIKFVDSIPNADSGFAETPPPEILVGFTDNSIDEILKTRIPNFKDFIAELLAQDPRPAFKRVADSLDREYGVSLYGYNVKWVVKNNKAIVISCKKL